jgi:hypothetical protein
VILHARGRLYTSGRPGRATFGRKRTLVPEDVIDQWADGLPAAQPLHIVSLLGRKTDGFSEFGYYPFRSSDEDAHKPTLQEWLDDRYGRQFVVHEYPTIDAHGIAPEVAAKVAAHVVGLVSKGCDVVIVDSAGAERTDRICELIGYERGPLVEAAEPRVDSSSME